MAYRDTVDIDVEQDDLKVHHRHEWDSSRISTLYLDLAQHEKFFGSDNDFSSLSVVDSQNGAVLFSTPVPALTRLAVLDGGELIVGLSNVMLYNPYQIVVYSRNGERLLAQHVSAVEACLSQADAERFWLEFPRAKSVLEKRVTVVSQTHYVDYSLLGMPNTIEKDAWDSLVAFSCASHLSPNISESVTNWVFWYDFEESNLAALRTDTGWTITLDDPTGETITFKVVSPN